MLGLTLTLDKKMRVFLTLRIFLRGLLAGKVDCKVAIDTWTTIYQNLLDGYNEVCLLTTGEVKALPYSMIAIELLFVTYWNA